MKKLVSLIILALTIISCDEKESTIEAVIETKDLTAIRTKRSEITNELKALEDQIKKLDQAIAELDDNVKIPLVSTMTIQTAPFYHYLELQGDVKTDQNLLIYPEMPGTLFKVYVKEGQKVQKGQLLASIDDGGLSSQLAQIKTQLALAKTTFERQKRLWDQNIGSEIQYLQAKSLYEAQESTVKQLESQIAKSSIRAPFSGIIDEIIKEQGTVVAPGMGSEVFRIVNLSNMYVEVEVSEAHLAHVTAGKNVEIYFPVLGKTIQSKVLQTSNFVNPDNRSFRAEIPIPNKNAHIKPNLTAITKINDYTNETAILIPQSVVSENALGEQYVYKTLTSTEGILSKKAIIELGKTQGDIVEVISGLDVGDQIIVEGARSIRDNQPVKVLKESETVNK